MFFNIVSTFNRCFLHFTDDVYVKIENLNNFVLDCPKQ